MTGPERLTEHKTEHLTVAVGEEVSPDVRLDRYITDSLDLLTRSQLKVRVVGVQVNGKPAKLSRRLKPGDIVEVGYRPPIPHTLQPEPMELEILHEDSRVIVINKPRGVVVHPGSGHWTGTLVGGILHHCREVARSFEGEEIRPGIVHRLDKDTSGVIVIAKNPDVHQALAEQFQRRSVKKVYYAVVKGVPAARRGEIDVPIERDPRHRKRFRASPPESSAGRASQTRYRTVRAYDGYSLMRFAPRTGRTHQIRVHAVWLRCPILGDPVYSRPDQRFRDASLMLHAYSLRVVIPGDSVPRLFRAPLPDRFTSILTTLEGQISTRPPTRR